MNIRKPKTEIRKIVLIIVAALVIATPSFALDNPQGKLAEVIEDYVVATYPDWGKLDINIKFKFADKLFEGLKQLSDETTFQVVEVYRDFKPVGNVIFPILVDDQGEKKKIFVRAKVEVFKDVVVAKERIKRGQVIAEDDVAMVQRDIAMLPQKYFENDVEVIGTEAKTSIPKNGLVFRWMIKEVPLVRRGEPITIIVKGEGVLLRVPGVALMDGYLGKKFRIKKEGVTDPKKIMEGKLISTNEVEVKI